MTTENPSFRSDDIEAKARDVAAEAAGEKSAIIPWATSQFGHERITDPERLATLTEWHKKNCEWVALGDCCGNPIGCVRPIPAALERDRDYGNDAYRMAAQGLEHCFGPRKGALLAQKLWYAFHWIFAQKSQIAALEARLKKLEDAAQ